VHWKEDAMNALQYTRFSLPNLAVTLALATTLTFTGCRSAQDKANDAALAQAEQIAASTGTPQRASCSRPCRARINSRSRPPP